MKKGTRAFVLAGLALVLLVAGVASYYASTHPDGLEYVAERTGFSTSAEPHAAEDGPLADYEVEGVKDARLAGGVAGVVGVSVTLLLTSAVVFVVRRSRPGKS